MNSNTSLSPTEARLRQLLGNYFLGLTSPDEEEELRASLRQISPDDADRAFRDDAELFLAINDAASSLPPVPEGFEAALASHIDSLAADEAAHKRRLWPSLRPRIYAWISAGVAAAVAGILFFSPLSAPYTADTTPSEMIATTDGDRSYEIVEITDPEKAQRLVGRSLAMLSGISAAAANQTIDALNAIDL